MKGKYRRMKSAVELRPYPQLDFLIQHGRGGARKLLLPILIVALALVGLVGFGTALADPSVTVLAAGAAGIYQISCLTTAPTHEPCLPGQSANSYETPNDTAVLLNAHVTDSSGQLASSGLWVFQDCLLKGLPAPSSACDSGSGLWSNIQEVHFRSDLKIDVRIAYGIVSTPQTIGFRFRYLRGQQIGIANGISNSMDVTWF